MSTPTELRVEIPLQFDEDGRTYWVSGDVRLGGRWPSATKIRCIEQRTEEEVSLDDDAAIEKAELALIAEAQRMTAKAWP